MVFTRTGIRSKMAYAEQWPLIVQIPSGGIAGMVDGYLMVLFALLGADANMYEWVEDNAFAGSYVKKVGSPAKTYHVDQSTKVAGTPGAFKLHLDVVDGLVDEDYLIIYCPHLDPNLYKLWRWDGGLIGPGAGNGQTMDNFSALGYINEEDLPDVEPSIQEYWAIGSPKQPSRHGYFRGMNKYPMEVPLSQTYHPTLLTGVFGGVIDVADTKAAKVRLVEDAIPGQWFIKTTPPLAHITGGEWIQIGDDPGMTTLIDYDLPDLADRAEAGEIRRAMYIDNVNHYIWLDRPIRRKHTGHSAGSDDIYLVTPLAPTKITHYLFPWKGYSPYYSFEATYGGVASDDHIMHYNGHRMSKASISTGMDQPLSISFSSAGARSRVYDADANTTVGDYFYEIQDKHIIAKCSEELPCTTPFQWRHAYTRIKTSSGDSYYWDRQNSIEIGVERKFTELPGMSKVDPLEPKDIIQDRANFTVGWEVAMTDRRWIDLIQNPDNVHDLEVTLERGDADKWFIMISDFVVKGKGKIPSEGPVTLNLELIPGDIVLGIISYPWDIPNNTYGMQYL
jgi:hypothetical protein